MHKASAVALRLLVLIAALVWTPVTHAFASGVTLSCSAGERRLYLTVNGRSFSGVELYCGDRVTPSGLLPFAKGRAPVQIAHDHAKNLFVIWNEFGPAEQSGLTILDPTGVTLAEHPAPRLGRREWMFVDKNRSTANFIYHRNLPSDDDFARFETLFRLVGIERVGSDVTIPVSILANAATIDPLGHILINEYAGRPGYASIFDPQKQKVIDGVYAPACAMAAGADGLVYAINCAGKLRVFDPKNYDLVNDVKLDVGGPYVGSALYQGRLAIDPTGTVFVSNGNLGTILRYNRGETKPSATAINVPRIVDLELDSAGNVYALEGGDEAIKTSIRVFSGKTLEQLREYDFDPRGTEGNVVSSMTIVDP